MRSIFYMIIIMAYFMFMLGISLSWEFDGKIHTLRRVTVKPTHETI